MTRDSDLDALLEGVEGIEEPSAEMAQRGKARLMAVIAMGAAGTAAGSASAASTTAGSAAAGTAAGGASAASTTIGGAAASGGVAGGATAALAKPLALVLLVTGAATAPLWGPSMLASPAEEVTVPRSPRPDPPLATDDPVAASSALANGPVPSSTRSQGAVPVTGPALRDFTGDIDGTPVRADERTEGARSSGPVARASTHARVRDSNEVDVPWVAGSAAATTANSSLEEPTATSDSAGRSALRAQELGTELLRRAIRLQDRGNHAEALRLVDAHRHRFPNAMLRIEREAIAIGALCALGRRDEAEARLQEIRGERDAAYLTHRIREHCD